MRNAPIQSCNESARVRAGIFTQADLFEHDSPVGKFKGTNNPRHLRVIDALLFRAISREELDKIAGCSNVPELIAELKRRGLELPCSRFEIVDRDGRRCRPGRYCLTDNDRKLLRNWREISVAQNG